MKECEFQKSRDDSRAKSPSVRGPCVCARSENVKWLRPILSMMAIAAAYFWSRLLLALRKEQVPLSGWGDGSGGSAATLQVPVALLWLATTFALCFICFKPYVRLENGLTRLGRWLTNTALVPVAPILLLHALNGPPARFFALYGFVALVCLWLYVDFNVRRDRDKKSSPQHLRP